MKEIFISYAREDKKEVETLYWKLKRCEFDVWIDFKELKPGEDWQLEIEQAIRNCKIFIACLSTKSVTKKGYVQSELKQAMKILEEIPEGGVFLIPVRLDECDVPLRLQHLQYSNLFEDGSTARLISSITSHLRKNVKDERPEQHSVFEFINIGIDKNDVNWAEVPLPEEPKMFDLEYKQFFKLVKFVHSADLVFDVTLINSLSTPSILTRLGIEIVWTSHTVYVYGIPEAAKIIKTDAYELEIPNIYKRLDKGEWSIEATQLNEIIDMALPDPIYFEPQAPYRFSLHLKHYSGHIPNHTLIRLIAKTNSQIANSHLIRTFTL